MKSITTWNFEEGEPLRLARRFSDVEGTAFLCSGTGYDSARHSFLTLFPDRKIELTAGCGCWEQLQKDLGNFEIEGLNIPKWVGFLGYEMGAFADQDKTLPVFPHRSLPDCCFYAPTTVICFNHTAKLATLYSRESTFQLERSDPLLRKGTYSVKSRSDNLKSYREKIALAKEWILSGGMYQINLSQEIWLEGIGAPFTLFEKIALLNPAPFSAFLNCGSFSIVSSSPERFLCKVGETLETRPIKGTAARGRTPIEDAERQKALIASQKELAELLMITDLMRSDIGRVALPGSVEVVETVRCEAYANVFHLLSIIKGRVKKEIHPINLIRPLFPGGSVTGCPKLSAMEGISALEQRARGIYTGSIGYLAENGDFDFNVAIRTLVVHPDTLQLQIGGAIVMDSHPDKEYEETLYKGRSLFSILGIEEFINT